MITPMEMARMVDHTLLKPEATTADVESLCREAVDLGVYSVCVSPSFLPLSSELLGGVKVATVCGFPSGKHKDGIKATEAARSVTDGADEVDMVIDIGNVIAGDWQAVQADVRAVRDAIPATVLKVIIESAALSDLQIMEVCRVCADLGADFVKTSTGFGPGGATVEDVALMRRVVGPDVGVKASGGVRNYADTQAMIAAGATRIGASAGVAIVSEARR